MPRGQGPESGGTKQQDPNDGNSLDPNWQSELAKVWAAHGYQNWQADTSQTNSGGGDLQALIKKLMGLGAKGLGSGGGGNVDGSNQDVNATTAANEQKYNEYLTMIQKLIGDSGYDFFAPKTTTQTGRSVSDTTPTFSAAAQPLIGKLSSLFQTRLDSPTSLPEGYLGSVIRGTNDAYRGAQVAANNTAARRGLSAEQAVAIGTPIEAARAGKIADAANNMPLLGRQLQNEDISLAQSFADTQKGQHQVTNSSGSTTTPANIGDYLAYLNMLQPYMKPIVVPGASVDNTGAYVGAGASLLGALIGAYAGK